jgi:hypothetical protein
MSAVNNARLTSDQHQQKAYCYHPRYDTSLVTSCIDLCLVVVVHTYVTVEGNPPGLHSTTRFSLSELGEVWFYEEKVPLSVNTTHRKQTLQRQELEPSRVYQLTPLESNMFDTCIYIYHKDTRRPPGLPYIREKKGGHFPHIDH